MGDPSVNRWDIGGSLVCWRCCSISIMEFPFFEFGVVGAVSEVLLEITLIGVAGKVVIFE